MREEDLRVGKKVRIIGANSSSWVEPMDQYIGRVCTISNVASTSQGMMFNIEEDPQAWWFGLEDAEQCLDLKPFSDTEFHSILLGAIDR